MSHQPLNPALFNQLQARFGAVRITNAGQRRNVDYVPDPSRPGRMRANTRVYGEQYSVNCPFCGETRQRLSISYAYGELDPVTLTKNYRLWNCFNSSCQKAAGNSDRLKVYTAIPIGSRATQQVARADHTQTDSATSTPVAPKPFPHCDSIDTLPADHPAIIYLQSRGFDAGELAQLWQVYCQFSPTNSYLTQNRLIIPIFGYGAHAFAPNLEPARLMLTGWQSRRIGEIDDGRPKYLSCPGMEKSKLLYGLHMAVGGRGPVWICEGATDCWRIGPGAVAIFGKTISDHQLGLLVHHFAGRPIAVLLDRDARSEAEQLRTKLQRARGLSTGDRRVVLVDLPSDRNDPGECSQAEVLAATDDALGVTGNREQNVLCNREANT